MDDKKDIVDRLMLKPPLHNLTSYELVEAANEITRLRKERDEARRQVCKRVESASCLSDGEPTTTASDYARWCGWDCFKEDGKPCQ